MSSGPKIEKSSEKIFILPDDFMNENELLECWKKTSIRLRCRVERAKARFEELESDKSRLEAYLKSSKEYYAFGKLVHGYGLMTKLLFEDSSNLEDYYSIPKKENKSSIN